MELVCKVIDNTISKKYFSKKNIYQLREHINNEKSLHRLYRPIWLYYRQFLSQLNM